MLAGGPDLLAVDNPIVAASFRAGAQARDIGAGGRLGKQLAPDFLTRGELRQIALLGRLAAVSHHGRPAHALANLKWLRQFAEDAFFLLPNHALDRRCAAAAIFLWPVQAGPSPLRFLLLPGLADLDHVALRQADTAERRFRKLRFEFLRRVGVDPFAGGVTEFGFLRRVVEIHWLVPLSCRSAAHEARAMVCICRSGDLYPIYPDVVYPSGGVS